VAGVSPWRFVAGVAIGRGLRYGAEAWLARWYGDRAMEFVRQHLVDVLVPLAIAALVAVLWWAWRRKVGHTESGDLRNVEAPSAAALDVE
jgi:hypothetical protein